MKEYVYPHDLIKNEPVFHLEPDYLDSRIDRLHNIRERFEEDLSPEGSMLIARAVIALSKDLGESFADKYKKLYIPDSL